MKKSSKVIAVVVFSCFWIIFWVSHCLRNDRNRIRHHSKILNGTRLARNSVFPLVLNSSSKSGASGLNVLLLAYQRSGSSFLGELLSTDPDATYVFEPLIEFFCRRNRRDRASALSDMRRMFRCDEWALDNISHNRTAEISLLRKTGRQKVSSLQLIRRGCLESRLRVIKTIRLRMHWAKQLLDMEELNLKIVHLVRDPRAILNSMDPSETWKAKSKSADYQCREMRKDLSVGATLSKDRYILVRYEDLVENPLEVSSQIFRYLGLTLPKSLAFYVTTHTESERFFKYTHQKPNYFSTYRKSNYDFTSWKNGINIEKRKEIENYCSDIIEALSYPQILPQ